MVYFRAAWIVVSDLDDPNTRHHTRQVVQGQSWNKNRFWLEITGTNPVYVLIVVNGTRSTQRSANYSIHTYKHPTNPVRSRKEWEKGWHTKNPFSTAHPLRSEHVVELSVDAPLRPEPNVFQIPPWSNMTAVQTILAKNAQKAIESVMITVVSGQKNKK